MKLCQALVLERNILAPGYYEYRLLCPELAELARAGQFIEIKPAADGSLDPLLSRPISIYRINRDEGWVAVIFKAVGRGTRQIANVEAGSQLTVFGPVGNGFSLPDNAVRIGLVAGGIGMPPLFGLAEQCPDRRYTLYYGGRSQRDLLGLEEWQRLGIPSNLATDDGSAGFQGVVTELLERDLKLNSLDYLIGCGPKPMLKALQQLAIIYRISGALSLESYMACGVGACLGCTCKTANGYKRVCVDGPVFDMSEVSFDE